MVTKFRLATAKPTAASSSAFVGLVMIAAKSNSLHKSEQHLEDKVFWLRAVDHLVMQDVLLSTSQGCCFVACLMACFEDWMAWKGHCQRSLHPVTETVLHAQVT